MFYLHFLLFSPALLPLVVSHGGLTTPGGFRKSPNPKNDMNPMCLKEGEGPLANFKLPLSQSCPLDGDGYYRTCRGIKRGTPSITYKRGQTIDMEYTFYADHNRGACSVSILEQKGEDYFVVAKNIWTEGTFCAYKDDCPDSLMTCGSNTDEERRFPFKVTLPQDLNCKNCVLLWQWRVDSRQEDQKLTNFQWYDNCLDFSLEGAEDYEASSDLAPLYPDYDQPQGKNPLQSSGHKNDQSPASSKKDNKQTSGKTDKSKTSSSKKKSSKSGSCSIKRKS